MEELKKGEENLLKIINHYGVMPQLKYFYSEVFELNEAIINYENKIPYDQDEQNSIDTKMIPLIAEEIADVMVMIEQFKLYYGISSKDIAKIFQAKVDRQLERIGKE